jgi:calcineurin-like phosphoesterase
MMPVNLKTRFFVPDAKAGFIHQNSCLRKAQQYQRDKNFEKLEEQTLQKLAGKHYLGGTVGMVVGTFDHIVTTL